MGTLDLATGVSVGNATRGSPRLRGVSQNTPDGQSPIPRCLNLPESALGPSQRKSFATAETRFPGATDRSLGEDLG